MNPQHSLDYAYEVPFHDCDRSSRRTFAGGVVTVITLGKCCTVQ